MKEKEKGQEWPLKRNQFPLSDKEDSLYLRQACNVSSNNHRIRLESFHHKWNLHNNDYVDYTITGVSSGVH